MFSFKKNYLDGLVTVSTACLSLIIIAATIIGHYNMSKILLALLFIMIFFHIYSWQKYRYQTKAHQKVLESISDIVFSVDKHGHFKYISPNVEAKSDYKINDLLGKRFTEFIYPEDRENVYSAFRHAWNGEYRPVEFRIAAKNGKVKYMRTAGRPLVKYGHHYELNGLLIDITERKLAELRLEKIAAFDHLTGVYNRGTGLAILEEKIRTADRENNLLTICFVDIDNLKQLNDNYGHLQGDNCIKSVINAIKSSIRQVDTICRLGGDEFLIIFPDCSQSDAKQILNRIETILEHSQGKTKDYPKVTISYGLAEYNPLRGLSAEELIEYADTQMYTKKKSKSLG